MDENQNKDTTETEPPIAPFFNVMPKATVETLITKKNDGVVAATTQKRVFSFTLKNMLSTLLVMLLVAGIAGGSYFAYTSKDKKPDAGAASFPPPTKQTATPTPPPPTSTTPPPAVSPSAYVVTTPKWWQKRYFESENCNQHECSDDADIDHDGLTNKYEFVSQTDPHNPDTDRDGIGDGDEVDVFGTNPISGRTAGNPDFTDADYLKGKYDPKLKDAKFTDQRLQEIKKLAAQFGLHEPTLTTLGDVANTYSPGATSAHADDSMEAQLDRDAQRQDTIKKLGLALQSYFKDTGYYPKTNDFSTMVERIKPYNAIATNPVDPLNSPPYVYTYTASDTAADFTMTFYSETQKRVIKYSASNAVKDAAVSEGKKNDDIRVRDLESIRSALLIYSAANTANGKQYMFPLVSQYQKNLVPKYLDAMPQDPVTNKDYEYQVTPSLDSFTVRAVLQSPPVGFTGYVCKIDGCDLY